MRLNLALGLLTISLVAPSGVVGQQPFGEAIRSADPLSPTEQQRSFRVPPGFTVDLIASEPEIYKPLNLAFDVHGRLWVSETIEYPHPAPPDREGRDRVQILEDTNGDGQFDRTVTFADKLNIPIGVYPYRNGAIIFSIPHIWWMEDTDGDGVADRRTKLFGPMGFERDTHGMNNAFRRTFDGWLYACHGFNNETRVRGRDGHEVHMQSGNTYRMQVDGERIEQYTWGQVNPFGMTFDEWGNLFTADCHSKPIYQLVRGGYYPSFGKPHDGLGFVPAMMDHLHGSTAIAGLAYYHQGPFPDEYRGNMFSGNVMTSRVNRNLIERQGATYQAIEKPDLLSTSDTWFRPVDVQLGPDGALYVADFYNRIIGHYEVPLDHPGRDRHRGRIWRVRFGKQRPLRPAGFNAASLQSCWDQIREANLPDKMVLLNHIVDTLGDAASPSLRQMWNEREMLNPLDQAVLLWAIARTEDTAPSSILDDALGSPHALVRGHATRIIGSKGQPISEQPITSSLQDESPLVRLAALDALTQQAEQSSIATLVQTRGQVADKDHILGYALRRALSRQLQDLPASQWQFDELSKVDQLWIADVSLSISTPAAANYLTRLLKRKAVPADRAPEYFQHAARCADPPTMLSLREIAQNQFADRPDWSAQLWLSMRENVQATEDASSLNGWGRELVNLLLETGRQQSGDWRNQAPLSAALPWGFQARPQADGSTLQRMLSSHPGGEKLTGRLVSRPFMMPQHLRFYLAGHRGFPDQAAHQKNLVRLRHVESGRVLQTAYPPRNDTAQPVEWDLRPWQGQQARLEIVDGDNAGAYAWLAIGRLQPDVVDLPANPAAAVESVHLAAELASRLPYEEIAERIRDSLTNDWGRAEQRRLAEALVTLQKNERLRPLLPLIDRPAASDEQRDLAVRAVRDNEISDEELTRVIVEAPTSLQQFIVREGANSAEVGTLLYELFRQGKLPGALLTSRQLVSNLSAVLSGKQREQLVELTQRANQLNPARKTLINNWIQSFDRQQADVSRGEQVFVRHCAACHQLRGRGERVGPQLDFVGRRGLQRLAEDVMDPNRNVDVAFRTTVVITKDGRVHTGLVRSQGDRNWVLVDQLGKELLIPVASIEEHRTTSLSLMPENLADTLKPQELRDLFGYLLRQTDSAE